MKNYVRFNEDYFKKTVYEYQDWEFAFFRETAQNSCDAKATLIQYQIEETKQGIMVICEDNGHGMSEDILLNKFLVMGGTHKEDINSVGGFGYAKGIILFCHKEYEIYTNNLFLKGSYGTYNDSVIVEKRKGTKIKILMDKDMTSVRTLIYKLKNWVENSSLKNCKVFLNGDEIEQSATKFQYKKNTKIGLLNINETQKGYAYSSYLWVRMRGMAMFCKTIYSEEVHFNGFIDLNGKNSIECLTANRDGLKREYENGLSELIKYLSTELCSLQISKLDGFELNDFDIFKVPHENIENVPFPQNLIPSSNAFYCNKYQRTFNHDSILDNDSTEELLTKAKTENSNIKPKIANIINKIDKNCYPSSFLVKIDKLEDKNNRAVLKEYNMAAKLLNQTRIKKQSKTWENIVNALLQVCYDSKIGYLEISGEQWFYNDSSIHLGAILSNDSETLGLCSQTNNKIHVLFNPIMVKQKDLDINGLFLIAVHEVAHIFEMQHGGRHSYLMFEIQNAFFKSNYKISKLK